MAVVVFINLVVVVNVTNDALSNLPISVQKEATH